MVVDIHPDAIAALVNGDHGAPFDILGPQPAADGMVSIRALQPTCELLALVDDVTGERAEMTRLRDEGLFAVEVPGKLGELKYHYEGRTYQGAEVSFHDPYAFPLRITDYDIYLFRQGRLLQSYDKFGAHSAEIDGVKGVSFAVWAPNAYRVSRDRRFQQLGQPRPCDAASRRQRHLGIVHPRHSAGRDLSLRDSLAQHGLSRRKERSVWLPVRAAPQERLDCLRHRPIYVGRRRLARRPRPPRSAQAAVVDLRGASRIVAARRERQLADLSPACRKTGRLRSKRWATPTSN